MFEFYEEEYKTAEMKVDLAKSGYEQKIKDLSEKLKNKTIEEAETLIDEVKLAKKAVQELEGDRDYSLRRYKEEYEKLETICKG